jgi:hypothetical protein
MRKSVQVEKGANGVMTFVLNDELTIGPVRSLPLWRLKDFQEEQVYFYNPGNSKIRYGFRLTIKEDFFPYGEIETFNEKHILLGNFHSISRPKDQKDLIIGDSEDITIESTPGSMFKKTSYQIISKLTAIATLFVRKGDEESVFEISPGINEFNL